MFTSGYNFIIPTFQDVGAGTATYDLQNIKLVDAAGDMTEYIVGYDDAACLSGDTYYWLTEDGYGMPDGWYDDSDNLIEGVTVPLGTGFYLNCPTDGVKVQYAGQVHSGALTTVLPQVGYNMIGNATPVTIDLQNIKLIDAAGDMSEYIVGYDDAACLSGDTYYWLTDDGYGLPDGWYDDSDNLIEGVILEPGQGLYLNCPTDGVSVQLPSAL